MQNTCFGLTTFYKNVVIKTTFFAGFPNTLCAAGRFLIANKAWTRDCQKGCFRAATAKRQFFTCIFQSNASLVRERVHKKS